MEAREFPQHAARGGGEARQRWDTDAENVHVLVTDEILPQPRRLSTGRLRLGVQRRFALYRGNFDLPRRLSAHRGRNGAKYTRSRQPVELLAWWHPATYSAARSQEATFKRLPRAAKLATLRLARGVRLSDLSIGSRLHGLSERPPGDGKRRVE